MSKFSELYPKDKKIKIAVVSVLYFLLIMTISSIQVCIFPRFKLFGTVADATLCAVIIMPVATIRTGCVILRNILARAKCAV